ncbi:membrane-bound lytic murein transglycosylase A [Sphingomonas jinjuensis]|uniref:peptidoglycan lytic exotransglycosylase n=1 Tax=Sphingomonas jinjuensis TaxID=535907 RepID=A0A840F774_9SPHN|nr:murein transglycosylase A [Sphingomonas jinjuensis]MBB4155113.1 membrane-bound lytic murein transglycosylase A [Sphingomonas jinjuensis]
MRFRGGMALAASVALSACVGSVEPPARPGQPATSYRPTRSTTPLPPPTAAQQVVPSGRAFDGRIVGATPLAAAPVFAAPITPTNAAQAGLLPGPGLDTLPISEAEAEAARAAFLKSCPGLQRRVDATGLTTGADWQPACVAAASVPRGGARAFLASYFEAVQVGDGKAFATGYYEPEILASRERRSGYEVPIYARPNDLIDVDLGQFTADLRGKKIRGRVDGSNLIPYYDRAQIVAGTIADRTPVLAWGADEAAVFFLQIQGSGRLRLPDGSIMRVGYDTQNGRDYTGIGKLMKDRGLLQPGQTSMQGIVAWLHANPEAGRAIMNENKSFVFFRELNTPPVGAMGYVVSGGVSVAADPKFVPLGAPIFLSMDRQDASGLWVAQDTGGAIRGANRVDTFWGAGRVAETTAGGMAARGTAWLLLPTGTLAKLQARAATQP